MSLKTVYVLGTSADSNELTELCQLIERSRGPDCTVSIVTWPVYELPWLGELSSCAVVVAITRDALDAKMGWAQALTSPHIDGPRTVALFLSGLTPKSHPEVSFRSAFQITSPTIADASQELVAKLDSLSQASSTEHESSRLVIDTKSFVGRGKEVALGIELAELPTKSIAIIGLGGQGKTLFAAVLAEKLASRYARVVWISLRNAPTLDWVAQQIADALSAEISVVDATAEAATRNVVRMLSAVRVLVVLDNAETVFTRKHRGGHVESIDDLSAHYEYLFRAIAEAQLLSLVVVTSRELPNAYRLFPEVLRVLRLPGLDDAAVTKLMNRGGIEVSAETIQRIQARLLGNPLAVKLLCGLYIDRSGVAAFNLLSNESEVNVDISALMDEHITRLSTNERLLLAKIAWEGGTVIASKLNEMAWPIERTTVNASLSSLVRLLLVDADAVSVSIAHPLVREYLVEEVKRDVRDALLNRVQPDGLPSVLVAIPLVNHLAYDYLQTQQVVAVEHLVADIARQLGTRLKLRTRLLGLIELARATSHIGYAVANLIELGRRGSVGLRGLDLSGLPLERVDFRDIDIRDANCNGGAFRSCVFGDNFGPVTAVVNVRSERDLVAAGTFEGFVRLWTANGELQSAFKCAEDWISAITPPNAGNESFFAAVDGLVGCVNWQTLGVRTIAKLGAQVRGLASMECHLIAACADGTISLLSPTSGDIEERVMVADFRLKVVRAIPGQCSKSVLLAGDSKDLLIFDVPSRKITSRIAHGDAWVRDVIFNSSGDLFYTADDAGKVRMWKRSTGDIYECTNEASHAHRVWCLALDEQTGRLYSAGNDSVIRVWDANSLNQLDLYEGHGSWVRAMALTQGGRVLVSGSEDQTLRFWETGSGECFRRRTGYAHRVFAVAFWSDNGIICGTGDHKLVKFDISSSQSQPIYLEGHRDQVFAVCADQGSNRVASASDDGEVRVSDLVTGDTVYAERLHTGWIGAIAYSPSGLLLVSGADDRRMVVVDAVNLVPVGQRLTHDGRISSIVFAHDGAVVCTSEDGTLRVIEVPSLDEQLCIQLGKGPLYSIGLLPGNSAAIVAGVGGCVWRIDLNPGATPTLLAEFAVNAIWSIDVNPDSSSVALGLDDGAIILIDLGDVSRVVTQNAHKRQVWCVRWSPSGRFLASASEDGDVAIWEKDGRFVRKVSPPRLYDGMRIAGSEGLSPAERRLLVSMGAVP